MDYFSTRGASGRVSSAEAILQGLASDGGLFVPNVFPQMTRSEIAALAPRRHPASLSDGLYG